MTPTPDNRKPFDLHDLLQRGRALAGAAWRERVRVGLSLVIVELLVLLFHRLGNTVAAVKSRSALAWMVARWNDPISYGADYSIGWFLPFVSIYVVWRQRQALAQAVRSVQPVALVTIVTALLLHFVGARVQQPRLSLMALVLLLWGIPHYLYGWQVARRLIFPCAYLIFCIPMNFLDAMTFPLRLFSTAVSAILLNGLGIPVTRSGSIIRSLQEGGFDFNVADPCSGLRSILAMMALTSVYAYVTQPTLTRKWLLFLLSAPLAIVGNIFRIVTVALIARAFGKDLALRIYHDYSGYLVFSAAILLMIACGEVIKRLRRRETVPCKPES